MLLGNLSQAQAVIIVARAVALFGRATGISGYGAKGTEAHLTAPTLVIFIEMIGRTLAHGIVGLFIGPIIISLAWELAVA